MPALARHEAQETVLSLAFEGRWSHAEMAERVGVSTRTIERWVRAEPFRQRLAELRANLADSLADVAYAAKSARIVGLSQMAESARREYEARPWLREVRPVGTDPDTGEPIMLTNEHFNRDAHAAFRESLNDIAKELGERSNVKISATVEHSLIPTGAARTLADELLAAVRDLPDARERLAATLLMSGDGATES